MPALMSPGEIAALARGDHPDPFARLGLHEDPDGRLRVRAMLPTARRVGVVDAARGRVLRWLEQIHPDGLFSGTIPIRRRRFAYRLRVDWSSGQVDEIDDAYRFGTLLGDVDLWLFGEGRHLRPYERLGAHPTTLDGVEGTAFAVWAPNAQRVAVVGSFNHWDLRRHPMRLRPGIGVWEIFVPGVGVGERYKFAIHGPDGRRLPLRADPYARAAEKRPATASVVAPMPPRLAPMDESRARANAFDAPLSVYEVHAGSWRRTPDGEFLDWDTLADTLIPYARDLGFTHLEFMPVSEHPFDGSWGYQPTGLYAVSSRFGPPERFAEFVRRAHDEGLGVLLDWVPGHFPTDEHALGRFDGTPLYEHADPREGFHPDWNTLIYNLGRNEVANFLIGNALFWVERYGVDGLRVDAVASMLYRDYSRAPGEWVPNAHGGRENLESVAFLRRMNETVGRERPGAIVCAEESTAWPAVTRPPDAGGLGFHYKWNMGWMHDTLEYMQRDPIHRCHHQNELSFGLVYAFDENFVLPLSHDEVVHGKGSLLARMPGDRWQQFANLRCYYGFMWAHPGKKLLFMGGEFGQAREWNHDAALDWSLLDDPMHRGVQSLVRDLNRVYRERRALHARDVERDGFEWIDFSDAANSVIAFARHDGAGGMMVAVCNFTPVPRHGYRVGVPGGGRWREVLNTDSAYYGGSNVGNAGMLEAHAHPAHGRTHSLALTLPPLATLLLEPQR